MSLLPIQNGLLVDDEVLGDAQAKVIALCKQYLPAANGDAELLALYWLNFDNLSKIVDAEAFRQWTREVATPAESITRTRRACRRVISTSTSVEEGRRAKAVNQRTYWATKRNQTGGVP